MWPRLLGKDEYGIIIETGDETIQLLLNKNRELTGTTNVPNAAALLEEHKQTVDYLFDMAESVWAK